MDKIKEGFQSSYIQDGAQENSTTKPSIIFTPIAADAIKYSSPAQIASSNMTEEMEAAYLRFENLVSHNKTEVNLSAEPPYIATCRTIDSDYD
jgi:hypothetical protein